MKSYSDNVISKEDMDQHIIAIQSALSEIVILKDQLITLRKYILYIGIITILAIGLITYTIF